VRPFKGWGGKEEDTPILVTMILFPNVFRDRMVDAVRESVHLDGTRRMVHVGRVDGIAMTRGHRGAWLRVDSIVRGYCGSHVLVMASGCWTSLVSLAVSRLVWLLHWSDGDWRSGMLVWERR
jgi:hypothetical protein